MSVSQELYNQKAVFQVSSLAKQFKISAEYCVCEHSSIKSRNNGKLQKNKYEWWIYLVRYKTKDERSGRIIYKC